MKAYLDFLFFFRWFAKADLEGMQNFLDESYQLLKNCSLSCED